MGPEVVLDEDSFEAIEMLGRGRSDVWKVSPKDNKSVVYARKQFFSPNLAYKRKLLLEISRKISIMKRLSHSHIVKYVESYQVNGSKQCSILLTPVAKKNLKEFFGKVDNGTMAISERVYICRIMSQCPGCLIRALEYIHNLHIRHEQITISKTIKPTPFPLANIIKVTCI